MLFQKMFVKLLIDWFINAITATAFKLIRYYVTGRLIEIEAYLIEATGAY